jgi:hypothetical protein
VETEGCVDASVVANSFQELLEAQHFGDDTPDIDYEAWAPIGDLRYCHATGLHQVTGEPIAIDQKILIESGLATIRAKTVGACWGPGEYDEWTVAQAAIAEMPIENHGYLTRPKAFHAYLFVVPSTDRVGHRSSRAVRSRWKNWAGEVV